MKPPRPEKEFPKEYKITIYKLSRRRHFGLGYEAVIEWSILKNTTRKHTEPGFTKWGTRRSAEKWVRRQREAEIEPVKVESYTV